MVQQLLLTLSQIYLPAIKGYVPEGMVRAIRAFLEFCYLVRREVHTPDTLEQLRTALTSYHECREVFRTEGVRADFSLPRQHSMVHYIDRIWKFGAPNGLCSSITESRHITAIKEPWRRSNRFEALGQMLLTNQRLDKLAASRVSFASQGMLEDDCLTSVLHQLGKSLYQAQAQAPHQLKIFDFRTAPSTDEGHEITNWATRLKSIIARTARFP